MTRVDEDGLKQVSPSQFDAMQLTDARGGLGAVIWTREIASTSDDQAVPAARTLFVIVDDPFDDATIQRVRASIQIS